jgi:hypothetical protein
VLIIGESSIGAFLLTVLLHFYSCYYLALSFYSCTRWVPTISVLNLAIFPCYSNLLLKRRRWNGILQRGVLGYVSHRLSFLWSYVVFRYSVSLRVILVCRDIIYKIIVLYLWHLVIFEHFLTVCVEQLILGIHTMSTWFWHKNQVWQKWYQSRVNCRNASLDRRAFSLVLFLIFAKIFYSNLSPLFLIYKI